ncbi:MAG: 30S ribosomal protein S15 [Candidatus Caenarcaniphilales bacterium]|jgi:small subunit ribosomal protein S15|nr:30S ribosomal protein S15 [Candidatus Caenarcaniphilales bacterium]
MPASKETKKTLVEKFGTNPKDTGRTEVQIAILSADIEKLSEHLQKNRNDAITKRGLNKKVGKRKRLLRYLQTTDIVRYRELIAKLGIRK